MKIFFYLNSLYTFDMRKLSAPIMMHMDHVAAGECKSSQQIKLVRHDINYTYPVCNIFNTALSSKSLQWWMWTTLPLVKN